MVEKQKNYSLLELSCLQGKKLISPPSIYVVFQINKKSKYLFINKVEKGV